jgi:hypothetical protein
MAGEELLPVRLACQGIDLACANYNKKPAGLSHKDQPVMDALNQIVGGHGRWGFVYILAIYVTKFMFGAINGCGGPIRKWALIYQGKIKSTYRESSKSDSLLSRSPTLCGPWSHRDSLRSLYVGLPYITAGPLGL